MSGKIVIETENPKTQSAEAVKALLDYAGHPSEPLPTDVSLGNGRLVLVLSSKKDVYYTCTKEKCSCPSAAFRPWERCKHQKKYFPSDAFEKAMSQPFRPYVDDGPVVIRTASGEVV